MQAWTTRTKEVHGGKNAREASSRIRMKTRAPSRMVAIEPVSSPLGLHLSLSLRRWSSLVILRHPRTAASATSMDSMIRISLSADGRSVAGGAFARLVRAETRSATRRRRFAPTVSFARIPRRYPGQHPLHGYRYRPHPRGKAHRCLFRRYR